MPIMRQQNTYQQFESYPYLSPKFILSMASLSE